MFRDTWELIIVGLVAFVAIGLSLAVALTNAAPGTHDDGGHVRLSDAQPRDVTKGSAASGYADAAARIDHLHHDPYGGAAQPVAWL